MDAQGRIAELIAKDAQLAERDARIAELEAQLSAKDVRIEELEQLVAKLTAQVQMLTKQVEVLSEKLGRNSSNSHLPPSSDPPGRIGSGTTSPKSKPKGKRKRGGQRGHRGAHGSSATLKPMFGALKGILVSDRAGALNFWAMEQRQICLAHLLRKFVSFSERDGRAGAFGRDLLSYTGIVFEYWHD